ncbi:MAG: hypothetical protein HZC41_02000 [Chloroflexi bacterium]|nr:hypothetical protein [Chloroflexota bacterium]
MAKLTARLLPTLVIVALLLPLLAMGYLGQYSRYLADDYCTTARALSDGVFGSAVWWYNHWAGQYTNWTVKGLAAYLGPGMAGFLPSLVLAGWTIIAVWTMYQIARLIRMPLPRWYAVMCGSLVVYAVLDGTPSLIQSLYWLGAVIPYTTPLLAITFLIGYWISVYRQNPGHTPLRAVVVTVSITFIAGGLSEVYVAFQTTVLALAFVGALAFAPVPCRRVGLKLLAAGIAGSLTALLIIVVAPGNAARMARFEAIPLPEVIGKTLLTTAAFPIIAAGRFSTIPLIVAVLVPLFICYQVEAVPAHLRLPLVTVKKLLVLSALTAFILIAACLAPPIQGTGNPPAARVYILPQFILIGTAIFWGAVMGLSARHSQSRLTPGARLITSAIMVVILLVGPIASASQVLVDVPDFRTYANEWDTRDREIRAAVERGERNIVTHMLTVDLGRRAALDIIAPDGEKSINTCAADYYGADTLTARTRLQMGTKSPASR